MLSIEFSDFLKVLSKLIDDLCRGTLRATLYLDNISETADLHIQQDAEFRVDDLLVLTFNESKVEMIKNSISFRINSAT